MTIDAIPNPIITGDAVLIHGQLNTTHPGGKKIVLRQRIDPAATFTTAQTTVTSTAGFYEFAETAGGVTTNRSWFVSSPRRAAGRAAPCTRSSQPHSPWPRALPQVRQPSVDLHRPGHSRRRPCWRVDCAAEADGRQRQQLEDDRQGRDRRRLELIHQSCISSTRRGRSSPQVRGRQAKRHGVVGPRHGGDRADREPVLHHLHDRADNRHRPVDHHLRPPVRSRLEQHTAAGDQRDVVGPRGRRELRADSHSPRRGPAYEAVTHAA